MVIRSAPGWLLSCSPDRLLGWLLCLVSWPGPAPGPPAWLSAGLLGLSGAAGFPAGLSPPVSCTPVVPVRAKSGEVISEEKDEYSVDWVSNEESVVACVNKERTVGHC